MALFFLIQFTVGGSNHGQMVLGGIRKVVEAMVAVVVAVAAAAHTFDSRRGRQIS